MELLSAAGVLACIVIAGRTLVGRGDALRDLVRLVGALLLAVTLLPLLGGPVAGALHLVALLAVPALLFFVGGLWRGLKAGARLGHTRREAGKKERAASKRLRRAALRGYLPPGAVGREGDIPGDEGTPRSPWVR